MEVLFTVVIPTYNRAILLERSLNSLVNQTYKCFEVIVCDDGSTDNSKEVVESFKNKLDIKYFWNENWGGPARPRNIGIRNAHGEWICFLDSDDWWYPSKLEECVKYIESADLIYHSLDIYTSRGYQRGKMMNVRKLHNDMYKDLLLNSNAIPNSSVVVRKDILTVIKGINESRELIAVEDFDCWLRIVKITTQIKYIPKALGAYWVGNENISISIDQIRREYYLFTNHSINFPEKIQREIMSRLAYRIGRMYQKASMYQKAEENYRKALNCNKLKIILKAILFLIVLKFKKNEYK